VNISSSTWVNGGDIRHLATPVDRLIHRQCRYNQRMKGEIHDLGHGVRIETGHGDGPIVRSADVTLPWRPRAGQFVGTAIIWSDEIFEVRSVERGPNGERWSLVPWHESEVARNITHLNADAVEALVTEVATLNKGAGIRMLLVLLSPLAGFLPAVLQRRFERDFNAPGSRATVISAIVELTLGAWWIINPGSVALKFFGWMLFAEGMVRLWFALTQGEPMGSFLTVPLAWFISSPSSRVVGETARKRDRGRGIVSDISRFVLVSFAPRRFQEQLTPGLNLGIRTLTWISAGIELIGGSVNLVGAVPGDSLISIDLLFALEGAWRLARAAMTGSPVGSILGLPFISVYERWVRSETTPS